MHKIIQPVILAVIRKQNKYLLTLRTENDPEEENNFHNFWQIPGGGLEFGESLEDCVKRETKEELGLEVEVINMLNKTYHDVRGGYWHGLLLSFLCKIKDENANIILNEESGDYGWYTYEEAKQLKMMPFCKEILALIES